MATDADLLRRYSGDGSEDAFAELVRRHSSLVYFGALRRTSGNSHLALDVSQDVFIALARNSAALSNHPALTAWLYTATRNAVINAMLAEKRRELREQKVHSMQQLSSSDQPAENWERLRPMLDDVLDDLGDRDRAAVLLRFFDGCSLSEVAAALKLTEGAAQKRVERALEKMHSLFLRRGVTSTTAAFSALLAGQAAMATPPAITTILTRAALTGASKAGAGAALLKLILIMNKVKIGSLVVLVAAALTITVVEYRTRRLLNAEMASLRAENREITASPLGSRDRVKSSDADELGRLRARIAQLKARPSGVTDAEMKPRAAWRNVGQSTPASALETQLWAASVGDIDAYIRGYIFSNNTRERMQAFFSSLNADVQTKYGTPERLFAGIWMQLSQDSLPAEFQVVAQKDDGPDQAIVQTWVCSNSGQEHLSGAKLQLGPEGWGTAAKDYPESYWNSIIAQISPATGELLPRGR